MSELEIKVNETHGLISREKYSRHPTDPAASSKQGSAHFGKFACAHAVVTQARNRISWAVVPMCQKSSEGEQNKIESYSWQHLLTTVVGNKCHYF